MAHRDENLTKRQRQSNALLPSPVVRLVEQRARYARTLLSSLGVNAMPCYLVMRGGALDGTATHSQSSAKIDDGCYSPSSFVDIGPRECFAIPDRLRQVSGRWERVLMHSLESRDGRSM